MEYLPPLVITGIVVVLLLFARREFTARIERALDDLDVTIRQVRASAFELGASRPERPGSSTP